MQTRFRIEDPAGAAARREAAVQRLRDETGIDETMIDALVEGFYAKVRDDAFIGPIFADRITRGALVYKTLLIMPYAVAPVIAGVLWMFIFSPSIGVLAYGLFCFPLCLAIFAALKYTIGLRVSRAEEIGGLDVGEHGMEAYPDFQGFLTK